ncbi:two-component system sensor histidine kinase NtrB [Cochlodiniinecator piscidefendens]|uniref:two-component system sensor histidine kinase NtrB n=1 Tax=Cochlodiniinecator piscidefendens TaxID=2715756 RepID=UPI001408F4B6|nr:ATP-binding protein [Cochlodiniinecator piscidefendens]
MSIDAETLWRTLPMPTLLIDQLDSIKEINPATESFLNRSRKSLIGKPTHSAIILENAPNTLKDAFDRCRQSQAPVLMNEMNVLVSGVPYLCQVQVGVLDDTKNTLLLTIHPNDMVGRVGQQQNSNKAARSAIGMAEMLAHEIKNPLAGITGAAQLLSMGLSAEDQELTKLIVEESRRIVSLLEQVEQFGNLLPPHKQPVNLHNLLDRARRSASVGFGASLKLVDDYDPSLPDAQVDPDQMLQVFLNLLKNAAEAVGVRENGEICIRTSYDHGLRLRNKDGSTRSVPLQVDIIDNGPGVPEDMRDHIFDPFVSGRENGTGLGLALVSKIIADHGGLMSLDTKPGRTVFRVSLPLAQT